VSYRPLYEDPTYDDDGQCVDEDVMEWLDSELEEYDEQYSPFETVNS
jgi:hypothetical protein